MRNEVHSAALRAAAKIALSVAFLGGCSGARASLEAIGGGPAEGEGAESTESAIYDEPGAPGGEGAAKPEGAGTKRPRGTACHEDSGAAPKPDCDALIASAFGDAGAWPDVDPATVSLELKSCCVEEIRAKAHESPNHWACCMATSWGSDANDPQVSIACTPWGPPVPPSMNRRRARRGLGAQIPAVA